MFSLTFVPYVGQEIDGGVDLTSLLKKDKNFFMPNLILTYSMGYQSQYQVIFAVRPDPLGDEPGDGVDLGDVDSTLSHQNGQPLVRHLYMFQRRRKINLNKGNVNLELEQKNRCGKLVIFPLLNHTLGLASTHSLSSKPWNRLSSYSTPP